MYVIAMAILSILFFYYSGGEWGKVAFRGLEDNIPILSGCGIKRGILSDSNDTAAIFDLLWKDCSEHILSYSQNRGLENASISDINLVLASSLVMGLSPQPTIKDYFATDKQGIFGNLWMQQHFSRDKYSTIYASIHIDHRSLIQQVRTNAQHIWNLHQRLVVDEIIVPFQGRWKYRQCVKGKPHNTGMKACF